MTIVKACDICNKSGEIHFRVKSINYTKWIFCCKKCWNIISKEDQYSYGGTRKKWLNIKNKSHRKGSKNKSNKIT